MKLNKKIIVVLLFIIGIAGLLVGSIAYYRIVVSGSIEGSTGNAVFVLRDTEAGEAWNNKVISLGQINPGDSGSFDVVMDASGSTVDMYATLNIDRGSGDTELPTNLKFYTTSDHKSELHKYYSFLEKSGTNKETLTIYWYWNPYIDDVEDTKYINKSFNASINVSAVQISEYAMMKNGVNYNSSAYTYNGTEFWNDYYRPYIRTITFGNDLSNLPDTCNDTNKCWDVSGISGQKKKVYAYLIDSGLKDEYETEQSLYNLYIVSEAPIFAPIDCSFIFSNFKNLENINFNNNFNTSYTTSMKAMFMPVRVGSPGGKSSYTESRIILLLNEEAGETIDVDYNQLNRIRSLDLSSFNTSNVTDMKYMFDACLNLINLNLENFNTSNVTDMSGMFCECRALVNLNLSSFNTTNVTNMVNMFSACTSLISLNLSSFNTSNVIEMNGMFRACCSLTSLDLSNFNTKNVTNMVDMFSDCTSLISLNLSNFNTKNVTNMSDMFSTCRSLISLNLSSFNTSKVTDMECMFQECSSLTSLDLSSFNTSKVTYMNYMFCGCSSLTNLDLSNFDISNVTSMYYMFKDCYKIQTQINIMNANTTGYTNMFLNALTDPNAYVILGYTADTQAIAQAMKATAGTTNQSKITLKQI